MSKENKSQLSDEFKKDLKEMKRSNNFFGILIAFLAIALVFGTVGIAGYQMLFKADIVNNKSAAEKIESRPEEKKETTAPVAATATTPTTTSTTADTTTTNTDYVVVSGDVLGSIATKFDTSVAKLKELNGITDENSLQIGQTIKVPKS